MAEPQPELRAVFCEALNQPGPEERAAYLDHTCQGKPELRDRVEALLRAHAEASSFLQEPAGELIATVDEPAATERPGALIGPYQLGESIGEGGFGIVFKAEQHHPVRRTVALKLIKPGMDSRQVIARFEAERQTLALMDHPHIAKVLDAGATETGRPYFVMELVKGIPITDYCDQCRLTTRERLELFLDVCSAVQHAHQKGVIHRDLKPSNVLVAVQDGQPTVKVIDFGVAKAINQRLSDHTLVTGLQQMIGTPLYMSPEQAEMSPLDVDTRADVYSLGVLLYELLTGTTPFDRQRLSKANYDEVRRILREEEPPHPSARLGTLGDRLHTACARRRTEPKPLLRAVRGELDWIVMKCLEKDRNRRYDTANALARDVERHLHDEPVQACPPSAWYRLGKFARRHRAGVLTATSVAAGLLLAVAGLASALLAQAAGTARAREEHKRTEDALDSVTKANNELRRARALEKRTLYFQRLSLAWREMAANNIGRAEELLDECPAELRGWEWHLLKRQPHDPARSVPIGKVGIVDLACSPDGRYVATAGFNFWLQGEVKVREAATGQEVHSLGGHLGPAVAVAFRPDSAQLATGGVDGIICLRDVATGKLQGNPLSGHGAQVISLSYHPDGQRLASAGIDGTVRVWDPATGAEVLRLRGHGEPVTCVAYSPDGRRLASWGMDFQVRVWDADTGEEQLRMAGHHGRVSSLLFHRDGRHLVTGGADGLRLWDLKTGTLVRTFKGINSASLRAALSPDGQRLASAGWDKTVQLWDWQTGQEVVALRGHTDMVLAVGFSGDGRRLFSASLDGTLRVWDATPLEEAPPPRYHPLRGHEGQVLTLAFSPDRLHLATASMDGTAKVWEVGTGKLVHTLAGHGAMVTGVAFHAGGKLLTTVSVDGTVVEWDAATGQRRRTLQNHLGPVLNAGFNPGFSADGERLTCLGKDGAVRVWETASGREIAGTPPTVFYPLTAFLSPDGQRLAVAQFGSVEIREVESAKTEAVVPNTPHMVHHLAFSADRRRLAAALWDGTVKVWDLPTKKLLHTFRHADRATCVAFHPDGRQLASGSCDTSVKVWDLETGREVETLRGHIGYVMALAYSGDGKLLATASGHRYQGEVQLWETAAFGKKP